MNNSASVTCKLLAGLISAAVGVVALPAMAATENTEGTTWGAVANGGTRNATCSPQANGSVVVTFPAVAVDPSYITLMAGGSPLNSVFAGDYIGAGIRGLSFSVMSSDGRKPNVSIFLDGRKPGWALPVRWENEQVDMKPIAGGWTLNVKMFSRSDGWKTHLNLGTFDPDMCFTDTLKGVEMIGIYMAPTMNVARAESYIVDNFVLLGASGLQTVSANLVPLQKILDHFHVAGYQDITSAHRLQDTDGDGMTDLDELLAGTDPNSKNSVFAAEIVSVAQNTVTIGWTSQEGSFYTVSRSADLKSGFAAIGMHVPAASGSYTRYTNSVTGSGQFFYRVMRE